MNEMYERNLPPYLAHDLDALQKGFEFQMPRSQETKKGFIDTFSFFDILLTNEND